MKLFYSPGACSLSPHIALREAGLTFDLDKVDMQAKQTASGKDYKTINAKGAVPAIQLDDNSVLTEGVAIVQYIADQKPESKLAPANGTMERYRLQELLNYISTEIHKGYSPLFSRTNSDELKQATREALAKKFDYLTGLLKDKQFLTGETFTVADGYLFTVLQWSPNVGIDLSKWPVLEQYVARVRERPAVRAAMQAEGILKS